MIAALIVLGSLVFLQFAVLLAIARLCVIEYAGNTGSWSYQFGSGSHAVHSEFDVETRELTIGPWYFEVVWGRWCK